MEDEITKKVHDGAGQRGREMTGIGVDLAGHRAVPCDDACPCWTRVISRCNRSAEIGLLRIGPSAGPISLATFLGRCTKRDRSKQYRQKSASRGQQSHGA